MSEEREDSPSFSLDMSNHLNRSLNNAQYQLKEEECLYSQVTKQLWKILTVLQQEVSEFKQTSEKQKSKAKQDIQLKDSLILCLSKINASLLRDNERLKREICAANKYLAERITSMEKKHLDERQEWQNMTEHMQKQFNKMLAAIKDTTEVISQNFGVNCLKLFRNNFGLEAVQSLKTPNCRSDFSKKFPMGRSEKGQDEKIEAQTLRRSLGRLSIHSNSKDKNKSEEENIGMSIQDGKYERGWKTWRLDSIIPAESTFHSNPESKEEIKLG